MQTSTTFETAAKPALNVPIQLDPVAEFAAQQAISKPLAELFAATAAIYGRSIWLELDEDPEILQSRYLVFHVPSAENSVENSLRRRQWYQTSRDLLPQHFDLLRLTIDS